MRHLIDRVLELSEEEQVKITPSDIPPGQGNEEELKALLESLQPRIRVYGAGGAGEFVRERTHVLRAEITRKGEEERVCGTRDVSIRWGNDLTILDEDC